MFKCSFKKSSIYFYIHCRLSQSTDYLSYKNKVEMVVEVVTGDQVAKT